MELRLKLLKKDYTSLKCITKFSELFQDSTVKNDIIFLLVYSKLYSWLKIWHNAYTKKAVIKFIDNYRRRRQEDRRS